jgi:pyruvate dehydrogenase E1 component
VRAYDPAFHFETAVIIFDGLKKLYEEGETAIYYLMVGNDAYTMPDMPEGCEEGIVKGMYKFRSVEGSGERVQLFGSGAIMPGVLDAQKILADDYGIGSDVWSVTSYTQLAREAEECARWNMLHPTAKPKTSYFEDQLAGSDGPVIASSDYVRALPVQVAKFCPNGMLALGTDGMGRSETREVLRRHFEVDAQFVVIATLYQLHKEGKLDAVKVEEAIKDLGVDPEKISALYA